MDFAYPDHAEDFRTTVREFLNTNLPTGWTGLGALEGDAYHEFIADWRARLHGAGLLAVPWPKEYGGTALSPLEQVVLAEEFAKVGVPLGSLNDVFSIQMIGNTLLQWGTTEQKEHFLPRILSGEYVFCQGFSEPNAGSDLAGLACRAELDGDTWMINGQKIWTSAGMHANWIFVLVRTDPSAAKHAGITMLLCPTDQEGVEIRPIAMLTRDSEFCETFFTDARTHKDNVVGQVNGGWAVAMTLLGLERGEEAAVNPIRFRAELDRLLELAKLRGRSDDPHIRQRLAWCHSKVEIMKYLGWRQLTGWLAGAHPGPESSLSKLYWSEYQRDASELAVDILGAEGQILEGRPPHNFLKTDDVGAPQVSASWTGTFLLARAGTIYAGSSEIQRTILGEKALGLPKEPG